MDALPRTDGPITISTNGDGKWTLNAAGTSIESNDKGEFDSTGKVRVKAEFAASFIDKKKLTDISTILNSVTEIQKATMPGKADPGGIFNKGTPYTRAKAALTIQLGRIDLNPFYIRYSSAADKNAFFVADGFGDNNPGTYRRDVQEGMAATLAVVAAAKAFVAPEFALPVGGLATALARIHGTARVAAVAAVGAAAAVQAEEPTLTYLVIEKLTSAMNTKYTKVGANAANAAAKARAVVAIDNNLDLAAGGALNDAITAAKTALDNAKAADADDAAAVLPAAAIVTLRTAQMELRNAVNAPETKGTLTTLPDGYLYTAAAAAAAAAAAGDTGGRLQETLTTAAQDWFNAYAGIAADVKTAYEAVAVGGGARKKTRRRSYGRGGRRKSHRRHYYYA